MYLPHPSSSCPSTSATRTGPLWPCTCRARESSTMTASTGQAKKVMKIILRYLVDEAADKGRTPVEPGEWKMRAVAEGVPRQEDGGSCGVFMCAYAERLAAGHGPPFMFSGRHVANLRKGMVLDLLRLKLSRRNTCTHNS
mmetsp:Transcript_14524/g.46182  ORF Transcript_14524/g.46182 Transcript_14524/m.46182 type:complete len:140 (-) Transcript_14524:4-423(-)